MKLKEIRELSTEELNAKIYELKEQLSKELLDKLPTEEEINLYLNVDEK